MTDISKWTPYVLAILRIITALLFLEHATMKFLQFPGPIQGVPYPVAAQMKFYDSWGSAATYPHMAVPWSLARLRSGFTS